MVRVNKMPGVPLEDDEAVAFARKVGARRTFLVHVCHDVGLHQQVNSQLPEDIQLAYDGQVVDVEY